MNVVIPFDSFGSRWHDNELRYMLRSLEKNLKMDHNVVLYGNNKPEWLTNVEFVKVERFYPNDGVVRFKTYECFFDTINKLNEMAHNSDISDEFIYIYDDIILLKKVNRSFWKEVIALNYMKFFKERGRWAQTIYASHKILLKEVGKDVEFYNYEHHIPVKFNKLHLKFMFSSYNYKNIKLPYAPISLYFSLYHSTPDVVLAEQNDIICYDHVDDTKTWLNYSDGSLPNVKEWIIEQFKDKSKYEL